MRQPANKQKHKLRKQRKERRRKRTRLMVIALRAVNQQKRTQKVTVPLISLRNQS